MKKAVKGIIGLGAVLAVLGGGLAVLKLTEPEEKVESTSSVAEASGAGEVVLSSEVIKSVSVKNSTDEFAVKLQSAATDEAAAVYTLEGFEKAPLEASVISSLVNSLTGTTATSIVDDNCENLGKFGLDSPEVTIDITYESGETATLLVGDITPSGSETYVKKPDSNVVYTVYGSAVSNCRNEPESFVSTVILAEPAEDEYPIVESLCVEREDMERNIYLEYDKKSDDADYIGGTSAAHIMKEPTFSYLSVDDSTPVTHGLFGLTAKEVYSVLPQTAEIAGAGLSEPFCRVTMKCDDGNTYVFLMSEAFIDENGEEMHYAMYEGGNVIYIVSAADAVWGSIMPIDVASRFVFGSYVWDITDMKFSGTALAEPVEFKAEKKPGAENEETLSAEHFNITRNGEAVDAERYRALYAFLIQTAAEDFAIDEEVPTSEPYLSVVYTDSYTKATQTVEIFEYSALNVLIVIDGEPKYFCSKSFTEALAENVKRSGTDEDYLDSWK